MAAHAVWGPQFALQIEQGNDGVAIQPRSGQLVDNKTKMTATPLDCHGELALYG